MRKRVLLILNLFLINFVSAYYGSYSSFSLGDLLDAIEPSTMILGAVFIISFAFVNFSLLKVFKDKYGEPNKATAGVVAFVVSLLITYGINRTGFDFEGLFFNIGISSDLLYTIMPLILLAGLIYLTYKFRYKTLIVLGLLLIGVSFTDLIYSKGATILIGIVLLALGFFWMKRWKPSGQRIRAAGRGAWRGASRTGRGLGAGARYAEGKARTFRQGQGDRKQQKAQRQQERAHEEALIENEKRKREQQQQKQIEYDRKAHLKSLTREYNKIQKSNPSDPRLYELVKTIKQVKKQKK